MEARKSIEVTCPDCRGPLVEVQEGTLREYRCIVGHCYSSRSILDARCDVEENALWAAAVALQESANLVRIIGPQLPRHVAARLEEQAARKLQQVAQIRRLIEELERFQID